MRVAVYPGSFDPVHLGHIDVAKRAAQIFDRLVVGAYASPIKRLMFSVDERVDMVRRALADVDNLIVEGYDGLTVDFARKHGAHVIVRGLRVISDFEMEYQMAMTTRKLDPQMDMVCLMTGLDYAFISSSIVKEIALADGPIDQLVPEFVAAAVRDRMRLQS
ncbi:MAG: pantetheine-phosphate adenylyltransferase [Chloroflexi bacterium]|nr:pantetheine-phosphate adenylyltransferase [Chloroflexota bacterium]